MKSIRAGAQRLLEHYTSKKEPITVFQLEQLAAYKEDSMDSSCNIRSVVICLLAFAAFLRFDELAKLVRSDVKIENDILNYLSYKQRCCAEISSPEKSRYNTREKISYFFTCVWCSRSAADKSFAFGATRLGRWMNGKAFTILNPWQFVGIFSDYGC